MSVLGKYHLVQGKLVKKTERVMLGLPSLMTFARPHFRWRNVYLTFGTRENITSLSIDKVRIGYSKEFINRN